jgi:hypothetical protein
MPVLAGVLEQRRGEVDAVACVLAALHGLALLEDAAAAIQEAGLLRSLVALTKESAAPCAPPPITAHPTILGTPR